MFNKLKEQYNEMSLKAKVWLGTGGASAGAMVPVFAQDPTGIDVSGVVGSFSEVAEAVILIGGAMLIAISAGIAFRWVVAYLAK